MTDHDQLSEATRRRMATLPNVTALTLEWSERAAIREHDGGQSREQAEVDATREIWQRYPGSFHGINPLSLLYALCEADHGRDFLLHALLFTDLYPPMVEVGELQRATG